MRGALILDTGAWLLALAGEQPYEEMLTEAGPVYVPGLVLAEVAYHLRKRRRDMHRLLRGLDDGLYVYEPPSQRDLSRALEIDRKFSSVRLGLVDSTVAALAERLDCRRVLTIDSDFYSVRVGTRWDKALDLVVPPPRRQRSPP